jgi:hypothetical protein
MKHKIYYDKVVGIQLVNPEPNMDEDRHDKIIREIADKTVSHYRTKVPSGVIGFVIIPSQEEMDIGMSKITLRFTAE